MNKKVVYPILAAIAVFIIIYLLFSLVSWEINPVKWVTGAKVFCAFVMLVACIGVVGGTAIVLRDKDDWSQPLP